MNWPQYTFLAIALIEIGIYLAKHGEEKRDWKGDVDRYNFAWALASYAFLGWLLYAGGFFK